MEAIKVNGKDKYLELSRISDSLTWAQKMRE